MSLGAVAKPAEKIAFYCVATGGGLTDPVKKKALGYVPHAEGSLYVYADGHAKYGVLGKW